MFKLYLPIKKSKF